MIEVVIPGRPVPWARAGSNHGRYFTPDKQRDHRQLLALLLRKAAQSQDIKQLTGPIDLGCVFDYGEGETRITVEQINESSEGYRIARPDLDNLVKQIFEALEDSRLLGDDAQVALLHAEKWKG